MSELFHDLDFSDRRIYWYASDLAGCIACFDTDGMAILPRKLLLHFAESLDEIDRYFWSRNEICLSRNDPVAARWLFEGRDVTNQVPSNWVYSQDSAEMGRKGIFGWNAIPAGNKFTGYVRT